MSGGIAYVYDEDGRFAERCNMSMVALEKVLPEAEQAGAEVELAARGNGRVLHVGQTDEALLRSLIERHLRFTGSTRALSLLDHWETARSRFVKVFPHEYRRALGEQYAAKVRAEAAIESRQKEAA
jgi:glutamate synthase domain-containing protein 3